jgi:IS5 family transposase
MKQQSFAVLAEFERFQRPTRRAEFLSQMNLLVPWAELALLIEPHYPRAKPAGLRWDWIVC